MIEHFRKLNPQHKRKLLQDLSDEYDLLINLDLISSLKRQLSESQQKLGEANSYISELEAQLDVKSADEFWQSLSKIERESYREKIAAKFYTSTSKINVIYGWKISELNKKVIIPYLDLF